MKADRTRLSELLYRSFDLEKPDSRQPVRDRKDAADKLADLFNAIVSEEKPLPPSTNYGFSVVEDRARTHTRKTARYLKPARRNRRTFMTGMSAAAAAVLLLFSGLYFSGSSARPYTLLSWQGQPAIRANDKKSPLKQGIPLRGKISIVTGEGESVRISAGILRIHLSSKSRIILEPVTVAREGAVSQVRLHSGLAAFDVRQKKWKRFNVRAGNNLIQVTGTRFAVEVTGQKTRALVSRGEVSVQAIETGEKQRLTAGMGALVQSNTISLIRTPGKKHSFRSVRKVIEEFEPRSRKKSLRKTVKKGAAVKRHLPGKVKAKPATFSEKVYLKDGTVITGRILSQNEKELLIRTSLGPLKIGMANIRRIVYSK